MWCVICGFQYEGENFESLKLFVREVDARAYEKLMEANLHPGEYVMCDFREVM